ncbi:MAG: glycosyltransferase [Candidatus Uhrbacteria bacterium]|nr:glycosyltransferase [Candidatus Uhrbacteria bacterium]
MSKNVLVFCVPFSGHLNVLKSFINVHGGNATFKLVVTGWTNIPPESNDLPPDTVLLSDGELHETDPALWTLPRTSRLLPQSLDIAKAFKPDIIIYDQFAIEGALVGKMLGTPTWCSIPAMIGPFTEQTYLQGKINEAKNQDALETLRQLTGNDTTEHLEMVSDGLFFPGDANLIWSYADLTPKNFLDNRQRRPYLFIGNPRGMPRSIRDQEPKHVLISLGTVVMNNLWNNEPEVQTQLKHIVTELTTYWSDDDLRVTLVTQGKQLRDHYPANWTVVDTIDQPSVLTSTDVFVTHAGSNSFHEAVASHVPMVAVPFFGDQLLVASQIEKLGIGINLGESTSIDTHQPRTFLNDGFAKKIDGAVKNILGREEEIMASYRKLSHTSSDLGALLKGIIPFVEGDLLYGTNVARKNYVEKTKLQDEFRILEFKPFSQLARHPEALPRIVDIYHDVIRDPGLIENELTCPLIPYADLLKRYKDFLAGENDICTMCLHGIEFFTKFYHIHFILDDYDPKVNEITRQEVNYVLERWERLSNKVIFYRHTAGTWLPLTREEVEKIQSQG